MKLSGKTGFIVLLLLLASLSAGAQNVTRKWTGQDTKTVLKEIEAQTGLSIFYRSDEVDESAPVRGEFNNAPVESVLHAILGNDVAVEINGKMIVLSVAACCGGGKYASRADAIAAQIHNPDSKYVVVACHRGDWRNYPENSIPAIESVIAMEADIVEIDIHMTADSVLVLCHDNNVRRTTNFSSVFRGEPGKSAKISDLTIDEIKRLSLRRAHGVTIDSLRMPTLREALECTKDRICVNIDKGYDYYDDVLALTEELGVTGQVLIKSGKPREEVDACLARHQKNMMYMPIVGVRGRAKDLFESYMTLQEPPLAYEVCWNTGEGQAFDEACRRIKEQGSKIWVNTIWASLCGGDGNDDDAAFITGDLDRIYGQYIDKGVSMIQTDRPQQLIGWLKKKGHHTLAAYNR